MEVSTEISQKIRSAIKAKLVELGAYVDDELPDYIMVMVANKKSRAQMTNDLGLFLGANTETFTGWLHGLLGKLQTLGGEQEQEGKSNERGKSKGKTSKKRDKSERSKEKKSKNSEGGGEGNSHPAQKKTVTSKESKGQPLDDVVEDTVSEEQSSKANTSQISASDKDVPIVDPIELSKSKNSEDNDVEDVRQLLVTETHEDELAEELETSEVSVEKKGGSKESHKSVSLAVQPSVQRIKPQSREERSLSPDTRQVQTSSHQSQRKRKPPISVVASVVKQSREEEYDPFNPAVGSVASVVKVTSRKSSVPLSLQANRSLLMKAMTEAEKSIAVKRKIAVTRPLNRDDSPSEVYTPKRRRSESSQNEASPPPYIPSRKEKAANSERRHLTREDARHALSREDRRELISRSRRQELLKHIGIPPEHKASRSDAHREPSSRSHQSEDADERMMREVKGEQRSGKIKNFRITARLVPSNSSGGGGIVQQKVSPSDYSKSISVAISPTKNARGSVVSRLGKVVVERSTSEEVDEDVRETNQKSSRKETEKNARLKPQDRMAVSRLGKDLVRKQCEAAVLSVTSKAVDRPHERASPDSRVVHCDDDGLPISEEQDLGERSILEESEAEPKEMKDNKDLPSKDDRSENEDDKSAEDLSDMIDNIEPDLLDVTDDFTLDLDEGDLSSVIGPVKEELVEDLQTEGGEKKDSGPGIKFIVTLDGVDEQQFDRDESFERFRLPPLGATSRSQQRSSFDGQTSLSQTAVAGQAALQYPQTGLASVPSKITPPKIQPFSISLRDSDDEHEDKDKSSFYSPTSMGVRGMVPEGEMSALKKAKMSERCKFWPACAAGSACEFHHPTTHCKTFPNCKFGDKCLFIHPNCRFDSKCARPDCPFTHTSRRPLPPGASHIIAVPQPHVVFAPTPHSYSPYPSPGYPANQSATMCRFFPNCQNANCSFLHPKSCRFGAACKTPGCVFYHPSIPGKDKLKWQAQASPAVSKGPVAITSSLGKQGETTVSQKSLKANAAAATVVSSTCL